MSSIARNSQYEIARSTGRCHASGRIIEPGDSYVATLCERIDDDGFDRIDFSKEAWEKGARPDRLFSQWHTRMPEPNKKENPFVDDELLLNFFHRLEDEQQPIRIAFRFVIMLILLRKRLIKHIDTVKSDQEQAVSVWKVRLKGDDPEATPIDVVDPALSDDQVREVSDQLGDILQGSW